MRSLLPACLLSATILGANAITLRSPTDAPARVVHHQIQRRSVSDPLERDRRRFARRHEAQQRRKGKRDGTVSAALTNEETLYFMNISMGTPAQDLAMHIDTGSSDLWVNVASSQLCTGSGDPCSLAGTYSPNASSTYVYLNSKFDIQYVDGSGASGDYATDTVRFDGVTLDAQQFGIGYTSTSQEGVLGIGYALNEASEQSGVTYANVPQSLVANGDIAVNAYSLWLNDLEASTGSILFGGVDASKYTGTLETLPIIKEENVVYAEFIIALTGIGINGTAGSVADDFAVGALLDSGSSLLYLPNNLTQKVYDAVGASYSSEEGAAFVDCSLQDETDYTIDFTFSSSVTISVSMAELVLVVEETGSSTTCILGIGPADGSTPILGDTFLRSAYVVYDLDSNEISLAQTDFNSTTDDIKEITSSAGVPGASAVANPITSVAAVSSTGARLGDSSITLSAPAAPTASVGYQAAMLAGGAGLLFAAL